MRTDDPKADVIEPTSDFLPPEAPLAMLPCELGKPARTNRKPIPFSKATAFRRLLVFGGTALLTAGGSWEMYEVLQVGGITVLEAMVLAIFLALLAWIAFSFMSALAGFFLLW